MPRPYIVSTATRSASIDVEATRNRNGSQFNHVLVEIKCFNAPYNDNNRYVYTAIGQYIVYQGMLTERQLEIPLYLAIPENAFETVFDLSLRRIIRYNRIKTLIVNLENEVIVSWNE